MDGGISFPSLELSSGTTPDQLAAMLGTDYTKLKYFYYRGDMRQHYREFTIPKKNGGVRTILAPGEKLKTLQVRIAKRLSRMYKPRKSAKAFIDGSSIVHNAVPHCSKKFVFNIDLQDFFTSITFARVRGLLIAKPYSLMPETATVIAHLTTVGGILPQGAPSSPVLSNMLCASLDRELYTFAVKNRAAYTRYADDITFSFYCQFSYLPPAVVLTSESSGRISHYDSKVGEELSNLIIRHGFKVNQRKVRLQSFAERQVVTGLTVNRRPNVDRRYIRKTCALIHSLEKFGAEGANAVRKQKHPDSSAPLEAHVQGRLLFIRQVVGLESVVYKRLADRFNMLPIQYKVPKPVSEKMERDNNFRIGKYVLDRCWVVDVCMDVPGGCVVSQGSSFMIKEGLLVTCSHVLAEGKITVDECEVFRVDNPDERYKAKVLFRDSHVDLTILRIQDGLEGYESFNLEETEESNIGDRVVVLGFPNFKAGTASVGIVKAKVSNKYPLGKPEVMHSEIDKPLYPGNSGGPVLNLANHVVGIAARGAAGNAEGQNSFIRVSELIKFLKSKPVL